MKISKVEIKKMFGIKEFVWNGKDLELSGTNGSRKSAVLSAIKYALQNKSDKGYVITQGEKEGEVLVEFDNRLRIHRKVRTEKADYKSIKQGDEKDEKTESFVREIFTELQLNPVEFAQMDFKEQNRIILDLIDFKWDMNWIKEQFGEIPQDVNYDQNILCVLHDIQSEDGTYFKTRQDINREARNKQAFIEEIGSVLPQGYDASLWKSVNLGAVYQKIDTIRSKNEQIEKAKAAVESRDNKVRGFQAEYEIENQSIEKETFSTRISLEKQIAEMQNRIKAMQKDLETLEEKKIDKLEISKKTYESKVARFDGEIKQYEELSKESPTEFFELQAEATKIEEMKAFVNEYHRMVDLQKDVESLTKKSEDLTVKIDKARTLPGEILANAKIPIDGLEIKEGVPLINGLPISNLSEGEKLELCISVAVQREGALKMILIDGIERLATVRRNAIYKKLKSVGVQFIATLTTDDDKLTVIEL